MNNDELLSLIIKVFLSALGTVGLVEFAKNFIKTKKTWIYTIIMPFIGTGCYLATEYLPIAVVGSILTIGAVQLNYQVLVQGFKKVVNANVSKIAGASTENTPEESKNDEAGSTSDFSKQ